MADSVPPRSPRTTAALIGSLVALAPLSARAGGLELDALTARSIARAGAGTVSEASGASLVRNPAGLARAGSHRVQVGTAAVDDDLTYVAGTGAVEIQSRADAITTPYAAALFAFDRVVAAVAYVETGDYTAATNEPAFGQPADDVARLFPHRYAGTRLRVEQRALAVGAAVRATPWLALGLSVTAARVEAREARFVWAGFSGIDQVGDPERDLRFEAAGTDDLVPGVGAGVLVVPESIPIELAVAATWQADAQAAGDARLTATRSVDQPTIPVGTSAAELAIPSPLTVRAGARYLGDRYTVEVDADAVFYLEDDPNPDWSVALQVAQPGVNADVDAIGSAIALRDHAAVRAAADVEVVESFVWLAAGYAYRSAAVPRSRTTPVLAAPGTHMFAAGIEGYWNDLTLAIGYARTLTADRDLTPGDTAVLIENPFDGGTAPAAAGRYERSADRVGVSLEVAW